MSKTSIFDANKNIFDRQPNPNVHVTPLDFKQPPAPAVPNDPIWVSDVPALKK